MSRSTLSSIDLPGEERGLAVADFNKDHRPDFVAIQRLSQTRVWENQGGNRHHAGVGRHRWEPSGHRAPVQWIYDDGSKGPMREIHLGKTTGLNPQPPHFESGKEPDWRSTGQGAFPGSLL